MTRLKDGSLGSSPGLADLARMCRGIPSDLIPGLQPYQRLVFAENGLKERLTSVFEARVVKEILA